MRWGRENGKTFMTNHEKLIRKKLRMWNGTFFGKKDVGKDLIPY